MANITTELTTNNNIRITFAGRQGRHLRLTGSWTDWMLNINDFRDLIIPLSDTNVDFVIKELLNKQNYLNFNNTNIGQEYNLNNNRKIVRREISGNFRKKYQTVALFIRNNSGQWHPSTVEISKEEILSLIRAMITLDCPIDYCIVDSLRNMQYLLSILWVKKFNPKLLQGKKKPKADEIFRISLVK